MIEELEKQRAQAYKEIAQLDALRLEQEIKIWKIGNKLANFARKKQLRESVALAKKKERAPIGRKNVGKKLKGS